MMLIPVTRRVLALVLLLQVGLPCLAAAAAGDDPRVWLAAAEKHPEIAGWLLRRAAVLTRSSTDRAELYERIHLPVVRDRLQLTEAQTRESFGDFAGAALRYDSLGLYADAARVRLRVATTPATRATLRRTLIERMSSEPGSTEAQKAVDLLATTPLVAAPAEALRVARIAGPRQARQALHLFTGPLKAGILSVPDRIAYGQVLARLGRHTDAIRAYDRIPTAQRTAESAYLRAVSQARTGQREEARTALALLSRRYPADTVFIPKALFLAGDLAWQQGDAEIARRAWRELAQRYPRHESAGRAAFLAALIEWEQGRLEIAGEEWAQLHRSQEDAAGLAAGYWAGRAFNRQGNHELAQEYWASVIARDSQSYYAVLSARRLGRGGWRPAQALLPERFLELPALDSAMVRIGLLRQLDLQPEIGWERENLVSTAGRDPERLLAVADAFRRDGQPSTALALARRALVLGAKADTRTYRLIYPILHRDQLFEQSERAGVDPLLVAALIRQESAWDTTARSRVGALGLMQMMPATATLVARSLGVRRWNSAKLYDPETNLRFGTHYLAQTLRKFEGNLAHALAGYNAGPNRVGTWSTPESETDPELFTERIGFAETRNYVQVIQRNAAVYRALYGGMTP
jgi:soluble lytic murein transglycosylase